MGSQLSLSFSFPSPGDEDAVFDAEVSAVVSGNVGYGADVGVSATIGKGKAERGPAVTGEISVTGKVTVGAASVAVSAPISRDENTGDTVLGSPSLTGGLGGFGITTNGEAEGSKPLGGSKSPRGSRVGFGAMVSMDARGSISLGSLFGDNDTESTNSNNSESRDNGANVSDNNSSGEYSGM